LESFSWVGVIKKEKKHFEKVMSSGPSHGKRQTVKRKGTRHSRNETKRKNKRPAAIEETIPRGTRTLRPQ